MKAKTLLVSLALSPIPTLTMKKTSLLLAALLVSAASAMAADMKLFYDKPAKDWETEALPIGNGRLGAMIFGGVEREQIQFNEDSLWTGDEADTGSYQNFGELFVEFVTDGSPAANYRRELDISRAVHSITYTQGGVNFRREYFASHPGNVMVFRFSADKPGALTGSIALADAHKAVTAAEGNRLTAKGNLDGYTYPSSGPNANYTIDLNYEAQVLVLNDGGTVEAKDGKVFFKNANALTILLAAGTDYSNQRSQKWRGPHPHDAITERLAKASATPYAELLAAHEKDYQSLFNRLALDFGKTPEAVLQLPTDRRLTAYRDAQAVSKPSPDPELEVLIFQFARYLMISCSRPGDLPANLQGIWNNRNDPPWRSDYHANVNLQMNYWFVDAANLGECFQPYSEWLNSIVEVRREDTKRSFGVRGWATRWENGIFGGATARWSMGDGAWLAQNLWDHYAFTGDKEYLRTRAYPILKELCEFWEDILKENADGKLIAPPGTSPEHGPVAAGNSYDQQLAYDLFTNTIEASQALGVDEDFRKKVETMCARLLGPKIGKWGQLQEWVEDIDDPKDQHRHFSHMIAVHPGRQISPSTTPDLAEAAKVSMNARGDESTGWSRAWKICVWARLQDGNRAYKILNGMVKSSFLPNLLATHPPFQIDGNFGYAAGVCEMLLQSHTGEIQLLPALPEAWPEGKVTGLMARGNFTVDIEWKDGKVVNYRITSPEPREVKVRVNGEVKTVMPAHENGAAATQTEGPVTRLYVFGDSYSDNGAGYVDGNGPTAVVYLSRKLGIELIPATEPGDAARSLNFAVSGAQTGSGPGRKIKDALLGRGMMDQVEDFVARVQGGSVAFDPKTTLFFLAGGLNDSKLPGAETVANLGNQIRKLYAVGARRFRVALMPEEIPDFKALGVRLNPELRRIPEEMRSQLPVARIALSNWGAFFDEVIKNPGRYGIQNTKDKCAGRALFNEDATPRADPDTYFYYHEGHPSTAVHKVVGEKLYEELGVGAVAVH
jgi:alpha-L-fucosidase 2